MNQMIRLLKMHSRLKIVKKRREVAKSLQKEGYPIRFFNGGGTGSISHTVQEDVITEITVGSGFYAPMLFDYYTDFRFKPAAGFAIEVTRKPTSGIYTCLGGGYVASGSAGKDKLPQPYLPFGAKLLDLEGAGEVQTPICYQGEEKIDLGDPIFMRHSKAGELCERFQELIWIAEGKIVHRAKTYRGEGKCFL
jgi:D-serine deaminase-like pyridoxal phosphate-dependent protein